MLVQRTCLGSAPRLPLPSACASRWQTEYRLPVEGCPTGYLGAGGLADNGAHLGKGCTGGAHRAVDVAIFGEAHMYHGVDGSGNPISRATCSGEVQAGDTVTPLARTFQYLYALPCPTLLLTLDAYQCDVYDPEGALGWISAAWQTWLGLQAGRVFVHHRKLVTQAASAAAGGEQQISKQTQKMNRTQLP